MRTFNLLLAGTIAAAVATAAPSITGVFNAASAQPTIASAAFVSIFGSGLSIQTDTWSDFTGGKLPSSLDGVKVTINGLPAYIAFINPTQINVIVPDDPTTGKVPVIVTNAQGTSNTFMVDKEAVAPALFAYAQENNAYAVVQSALNYDPVAPPALLGKSVNTFRAAPYENVILWATGLGPTNPAQPTAQVLSGPVPLAGPIQISIGGQQVTPQFVGLVYSGVYQINLQIPALPSGDAAIALSVNGVAAATALVPIQAPIFPIAGQTGPGLKNCVSGQVDYITYPVAGLPFQQPNDVSIGGTDLCQTCTVQTPMFSAFNNVLEFALKRKKGVKACYDQNGIIYQVTVQR